MERRMTTFFVKPNNSYPDGEHYQSYTDYWTLIELSGYPIVSPDQIIDHAAHCYIHTWFTARFADWTQCRARHIAWILEWIQPDLENEFPKGCEVWASDPWYAEQIDAKYVVFGSHPGLKPNTAVQSRGLPYMMALMMYVSPRRSPMIHQFKELKLTMAPNGWGAERHTYLTNSRSMVHIHQHDGIPTIAPQRFAIAAAYHLPIISENLANCDGFQDAILTSDYAHLASFAHQWLTGPKAGMLSSLGHALHQKLCVEHTFGTEVEAAL